MQTLKHKIKLALVFIAFLIPLATASPALAAYTCSTSGSPAADSNGNRATAKPSELNQCLKGNPITKDINKVVNFLSAAVGVVVIGVIILGGIQYSLAGDNSTATGAAKQRITNGIIALLAFLFTYALLQWLIPGGL